MKIKDIFIKLLVCMMIVLTLVNFIGSVNSYAVEVDTSEERTNELLNGNMSNLGNSILTVLKGFVLSPFIAARSINYALASSAGTQNGGVEYQEISPFEIFFNKFTLLDANVFSTTDRDGHDIDPDSMVYKIRTNTAVWYYAIRTMAISIVAILFFINLVRAVSKNTSVEQKAVAKESIKDWIVSFVLVMFMHIIIIFVFNLNDEILKVIEKVTYTMTMSDYRGFVDALENAVFDSNLVLGVASLIVYALLNFQTLKYILFYIQRMLTLVLLIMISPIIPITYSLDKMRGGTGSSLNSWLKELIFNVFIQTLHAIVYAALVSVAMSALTSPSITGVSDLGNALVAITAMLFVKYAEKMVRTIFGFDQSQILNKNVFTDAATTIANVSSSVMSVGARVATGGPVISFGKNVDGSHIGIGQVAQGFKNNISSTANAIGTSAQNAFTSAKVAMKNVPNALNNTASNIANAGAMLGSGLEQGQNSILKDPLAPAENSTLKDPLAPAEDSTLKDPLAPFVEAKAEANAQAHAEAHAENGNDSIVNNNEENTNQNDNSYFVFDTQSYAVADDVEVYGGAIDDEIDKKQNNKINKLEDTIRKVKSDSEANAYNALANAQASVAQNNPKQIEKNSEKTITNNTSETLENQEIINNNTSEERVEERINPASQELVNKVKDNVGTGVSPELLKKIDDLLVNDVKPELLEALDAISTGNQDKIDELTKNMMDKLDELSSDLDDNTINEIVNRVDNIWSDSEQLKSYINSLPKDSKERKFAEEYAKFNAISFIGDNHVKDDEKVEKVIDVNNAIKIENKNSEENKNINTSNNVQDKDVSKGITITNIENVEQEEENKSQNSDKQENVKESSTEIEMVPDYEIRNIKDERLKESMMELSNIDPVKYRVKGKLKGEIVNDIQQEFNSTIQEFTNKMGREPKSLRDIYDNIDNKAKIQFNQYKNNQIRGRDLEGDAKKLAILEEEARYLGYNMEYSVSNEVASNVENDEQIYTINGGFERTGRFDSILRDLQNEKQQISSNSRFIDNEPKITRNINTNVSQREVGTNSRITMTRNSNIMQQEMATNNESRVNASNQRNKTNKNVKFERNTNKENEKIG